MKTSDVVFLAEAVVSRALGLAALACLCVVSCVPAECVARPQRLRAARPAAGAEIPVVFVGPRGGLSVDGNPAGTVDRPTRLTAALKGIFRRRRGEGLNSRAVIIKAPAELHHDSVWKVVAAAKRAGAGPLRLVSDDAQLGEARRALQTSEAGPKRSGLSAADGATPVLRDPSTDPEILKESSIVVTIAPDGNLYVGRRLVPEGELEAAVRSLTGGIPEAERVVYLRTHLDAPYGQVVRVIETIRKAGVNQIGLVTEERRR